MDLTLLLIILGIVVGVGFCFCLAVANFGLAKFYDVYKEINEEEAYCSLTPQEMVEQINRQYFGGKLRLHQIDQIAGDAYVHGGDLLLSKQTLSSTSIASYAVLAHELGHALQDRDSKKLKVKGILLRIGRIIGVFLFPSLIAGIVLIALGGNLLPWGIALCGFGVLIFLLALSLRLYTISVEKEASKNAVKFLQEYFSEKQLKSVKKLLSSAKLSYWSAFFQTLLGWTMLTKKTKLFN